MSYLVDPFDPEILSPKLFDGKVSRSSGIRLRSTGEISCDPAGFTFVAIIPGLSNAICWKTAPSTLTAPSPFNGHVGSVSDRSVVKQARVVSVGLRLNLINNADQNEGYWEAARVPISPSDFTVDATTGSLYLNALDALPDLANHQTYMTGKNRDLHRYQFKLNSMSNEHPFTPILEPPTSEMFVDEAWDAIIIKIHGRADAAAPTQVMFDSISNQEILYAENTALSRLMSSSEMIEDWGEVLQETNDPWPADRLD